MTKRLRALAGVILFASGAVAVAAAEGTVRFERVAPKQVRMMLSHSGWGDGGEWDKAYAYFDRA